MDRRHVTWLHRQLPELERQHVLSAEAATALRQHYPLPPPQSGVGALIVAILGSLLIGLGIVLLVAHNWDDFSRQVRTFISFAPLLFGQGCLGWALARRPDSLAARESGGLLATLGVFAAIALIGQTYHIYGNLPAYLLTCALLTLPLVYLVDVALPGVIVAASLTGWVMSAPFGGFERPLLWLVLMALAPWLVWRLRERNLHWQPLLLLWFWGPALALAVTQGFFRLHPFDVTLVLILLAGVYLVSDKVLLATGSSSWQRPLRVCGMLLLVGVMIPMSFDDGFENLVRLRNYLEAIPVTARGIQALLATCLFGLLAWAWKRGLSSLWGIAAAILAVLLIMVHLRWLQTGGGAVLVNLLMVMLGAVSIRDGLRGDQLSALNGGLALVGLTIGLRFFDSELPFLLKGLAFIAIGGAMIALNLWVRKRRAA